MTSQHKPVRRRPKSNRILGDWKWMVSVLKWLSKPKKAKHSLAAKGSWETTHFTLESPQKAIPITPENGAAGVEKEEEFKQEDSIKAVWKALWFLDHSLMHDARQLALTSGEDWRINFLVMEKQKHLWGILGIFACIGIAPETEFSISFLDLHS